MKRRQRIIGPGGSTLKVSFRDVESFFNPLSMFSDFSLYQSPFIFLNSIGHRTIDWMLRSGTRKHSQCDGTFQKFERSQENRFGLFEEHSSNLSHQGEFSKRHQLMFDP